MCPFFFYAGAGAAKKALVVGPCKPPPAARGGQRLCAAFIDVPIIGIVSLPSNHRGQPGHSVVANCRGVWRPRHLCKGLAKFAAFARPFYGLGFGSGDYQPCPPGLG